MSVTRIPAALRRQVRERAGLRCEYCLIPDVASWALHTIDHVVAEKHGGLTSAENLALACTVCNVRKGSDVASIDELTGRVEPLFNPRCDRWVDHFQIKSGRLEPRTPIGRVTAALLRFNDRDRIRERELLIAAGLISEPEE